MPTALLSVKTRQEIREYFVSTTLARIDDAFAAEGFTADPSFQAPVGGQRRTLVEQYYYRIDWTSPSEVARFLRICEAVLVELDMEAADGGPSANWANRTASTIRRWLRRDGVREEGGRLLIPGHVSLDDALGRIDAPELQRQIDRMRASVETDPGLAIGTAKELVETVCKTILAERGVAIEASWDLPRLVKEARQTLLLLPDDVADAAKGADTVRRVLSNLAAIVNGLAELRNLYGTGHGKHGSAKGVQPRHARLAVGAAGTLATFLFETHKAHGT